jgi:surface antigen
MLSVPAAASGYYGSNCVTYVREVTGINISGNAGDWWDNADGSYRRGHQPAAGAVLVFRPYGRMWAGHVAVVSKVVNGREILVNQANWPHGDVVEGAAVYDVSPSNDWTAVRVADVGTMSWGRTNPTFGFIYSDGAPAREEPIVAQAQPQFPQPQSWATQPWPTQPQPRAELAVAQAQSAQAQSAQSQSVQPQAQPQPRTQQPQPRFQLAVAETEEEDAPAPHRAAPRSGDPQKAKAAKPATHKELLEAKAAKAKADRHEHLEAKAEHQRQPEKPEIKTAARDEAKAKRDRREQLAAEKAEKVKVAKADQKAEKVKLAKAAQEKAEKTKLAKAEKAEQTRLAKAEKAETAEKIKLAKAEHAPAKEHAETKTAATHDHHPASRHTHVARNDQLVQGANIEQIAEVGRGGE